MATSHEVTVDSKGNGSLDLSRDGVRVCVVRFSLRGQDDEVLRLELIDVEVDTNHRREGLGRQALGRLFDDYDTAVIINSPLNTPEGESLIDRLRRDGYVIHEPSCATRRGADCNCAQGTIEIGYETEKPAVGSE